MANFKFGRTKICEHALNRFGSEEGMSGVALHNVNADFIDIHRDLFFSIVDHSSNAVVITDRSQQILYVNRKFEQATGYSWQEIKNKKPKLLQSKKTPLETYKSMFDSLSKGETWQGEFINKAKDGSEFIEDATITPIVDESGEIVYYLGEKKNITKLKLAEQEIYRLAYFDTLTQLPNRSSFIRYLDALLKDQTTLGDGLSVLFIDINRFKAINDTFGHDVGDKIIQKVAERLTSAIGDDDYIARVGGDEFAVIHVHQQPGSELKLAKLLIGSVRKAAIVNGVSHHVGLTIGSASWPLDGNSSAKLLSSADLAVQHSKVNKSTYHRYDAKIGERSLREFAIIQKLETALDKEQFYLCYQPKVSLKSKRLEGFEALLRWKEPELGQVPPSEFIPLAEKNGYMVAIGEWVLEACCQQLKRWEERGVELRGRLAINLSVEQLEYTHFFHNTLMLLEEYEIDPCLIEFEVTETALMRNPERILNVIKALAEIGIQFSIDDFGTGYSSLTYLKRMNASQLKIDQSFISNLDQDIADKKIVRSIIALAHNLGMRVVAEGVEHVNQEQYLSSIRCDTAQGYLYSKPIPADDDSIEEMIDKHYIN